MKLLRIEGENLASLERFDLDFEKAPLRANGLFAITGPTGSGKSTLLDALCLALYGETPRMKGNSTYKIEAVAGDKSPLGNRDLRSLVRRGAGKATAAVELEVQGVRHRAVWEAQRAGGKAAGAWQANRHRLERLEADGHWLALTTHAGQVPVEVEKLIGLDFTQFCRSVLLAQGRFAEFVSADPADRARLLSNLTGSEVYAEITRQTHDEVQMMRQVVAQLQQSCTELGVLSPEARLAVVGQLAAENTKAAQAKELQAKALSAQAWHGTCGKLVTALQQIEGQLAQARTEAENLQPRREELLAVEAAQPHRAAVQLLDENRAQHAALKNECAALQAAATAAEAQVQALAVRLADADLASAKATLVLNEARPLLIEARRLDALLHAARIQQEGRKRDDEAAVKALAAVKLRLDASKSALLEAMPADAGADLPAWIGTAQAEVERLETALAELDLERAQAQTQRASEDLLAWTALQTAGKALRDALAQVATLVAQDGRDGEGLQRSKRAAASAGERAAALQAELKGADAVLVRVKGAVGLGAQRGELLVQDQPCPLCGSMTHPDAAKPGPGAAQIHAAQQVVADLRSELERAQALQTTESTLVSSLDQAIGQRAAQVRSWHARAQQARQQWHDAAQPQAATLDPALEASDAAIAEQLRAAREVQAASQALLRRGAALGQALAGARKTLEQRQKTLNTVHDLQQAVGPLQAEAAAAQDQRRASELALANALSDLQALQASRNDVLAGRPAAAHEAALTLAEQAAVSQAQTLRTQFAKTQTEHAAQQGRLSTLLLQLEALLALGKQSRAAIDRVAEELGTHEAELRSRLARDGAWLEQTRRALQTAQDRVTSCAGQRDHAAHQLQAHDAEDKPGLDAPAATLQLDKATADLQQAEQACGRLHSQLAQDDAAQGKVARLTARMDEVKAALVPWEQVLGVVKNARGSDVLSTYAQGLTLDWLIHNANAHLADLTHRYQLQRVPSQDLELQVVDGDSGDEVRALTTLSGGESFLVSLALALALASLSGGRGHCDTLLIDEGFGTLDPGTLEIVLSALNNLQAMGRRVGVISHVEVLKERIGVHVKVARVGPGRSRVEVVGG